MSLASPTAETRPIRVLVLEESSFRREGVHNLLQRYASVDTACTHDVSEGLRMAARRPPDVAIVNLDADALRAIREMRQRHPGVRTIAILPTTDPGVARSLRGAGADELLYGALRAGTVVEAIFRQMRR